MAKQTIVRTVDDLDGSDTAKTVHFGWDGVSYEIDLSPENELALHSALAPYLKVARRGGTASRRGRQARATSTGGRDLSAVRAWAAVNGYALSSRGRIPGAVLAAFDAAGGSSAATSSSTTTTARKTAAPRAAAGRKAAAPRKAASRTAEPALVKAKPVRGRKAGPRRAAAKSS